MHSSQKSWTVLGSLFRARVEKKWDMEGPWSIQKASRKTDWVGKGKAVCLLQKSTFSPKLGHVTWVSLHPQFPLNTVELKFEKQKQSGNFKPRLPNCQSTFSHKCVLLIIHHMKPNNVYNKSLWNNLMFWGDRCDWFAVSVSSCILNGNKWIPWVSRVGYQNTEIHLVLSDIILANY